MVSRNLHESIDVIELVLVNNQVLAEIDMIHRLCQIHEGPAIQANILWRLQLIVELQKSGEVYKIR